LNVRHSRKQLREIKEQLLIRKAEPLFGDMLYCHAGTEIDFDAFVPQQADAWCL
jgi:hypothetical protein